MNTIFRKTISLFTVAFLIFAGITPAFKAYAANTVGKTLEIKKILTKSTTGVTTPTETFNFTATAQSFNGDVANASKCPALAGGTASYTSSDDTDANSTVAGKQLNKLSSDMLDGVTFTEAGQYTYTIKETAGSTAGMTYSKAEYLVSLFVVKNASGNFVVDSIQIKQTVKDDGTTITDTTKTTYDPTLTGNNLAFNNVYNKTAGNDNPTGTSPTAEDKKGLVIDKVVNVETNASFTFSLTLTAPEGASDTAIASLPTAKIVSADGTSRVQTLSAYGNATTFNLMKGERIVLNNVLLGSTAKIEETDAQGFTPTVSANGVAGEVKDINALKTTGIVLGDQAEGNYATVTNTQQTAVGVIISNLPFILLILLAIFGIAMYIRNRRIAYYED